MMTIEETCVTRQIVALESVLDVVRSEVYEDLLELSMDTIKSGGRICITGVGKNANIAAKASETMASLGIPSFYLNTSHYAHGDAGFIDKKDLILAISRSGTTLEMTYMIKHAKTIYSDQNIVLLHCNPDLAKEGVFIPNVVEGDENMLAPTTSTTALLCLLDCLSSSISSKRKFTKKDFYDRHPGGSLGAKLMKELE